MPMWVRARGVEGAARRFALGVVLHARLTRGPAKGCWAGVPRPYGGLGWAGRVLWGVSG